MLRTTFPTKILSRQLLFLLCKPTSKTFSPTKEDKRKKRTKKIYFQNNIQKAHCTMAFSWVQYFSVCCLGSRQYLTLLTGVFCCIVLHSHWFSDFWPEDRYRFFINFMLNTMNISLGYRLCIERAVIVVKELIRNKRASSHMFGYNPVSEALIPGQLEKG